MQPQCHEALFPLNNCSLAGVCEYRNETTDYFCKCSGNDDPHLFCAQTRFEYYDGKDRVILGFLIALTSLLFVTLLLEICSDVITGRAKKAKSWKTPVVVAKLSVAFSCLASIAVYIMDLSESTSNAPREGAVDITYQVLTQLVHTMYSVCYGLILVGWISMLIKAQSLASESRVGLFRKIVFIEILTMNPLSFICTMVRLGLKEDSAADTLLVIIIFLAGLVFVAMILVGGGYYLVKSFIWLGKTESKRRMILRVKRKTVCSLPLFTAYSLHDLVLTDRIT
eukprot:TRINITY_DN182_c0_g1_i2.p1 TRINITY_DN182_c0_g1~~TRINITY_DN182_c0_g1_i2.p1  ORF type:complete len:307 (+),score=62.47 TRINITY_DN182_c0_g1_i2:78-923(+)